MILCLSLFTANFRRYSVQGGSVGIKWWPCCWYARSASWHDDGQCQTCTNLKRYAQQRWFCHPLTTQNISVQQPFSNIMIECFNFPLCCDTWNSISYLRDHSKIQIIIYISLDTASFVTCLSGEHQICKRWCHFTVATEEDAWKQVEIWFHSAAYSTAMWQLYGCIWSSSRTNVSFRYCTWWYFCAARCLSVTRFVLFDVDCFILLVDGVLVFSCHWY